MKYILSLIILLNVASLGQIVYVDSEDGVYEFLDRLSLKHIIVFNDETRPKSRYEIASLLFEANKNKEELNELETEELYWYLKEYNSSITNNSQLDEERWYPYSYRDSVFQLKLIPIAGYGVTSTAGENGYTKIIGAKFWGTYSNWFGATFEYSDRGEFGNNVDKKKVYIRATGHFYKDAPNGIEFSDVKGSINFNWSWGSVSLRKDYNSWGHGSFGQLFISDKAASYPQILFSLKPASWFRFSYFHGWLNSLILDSASFYYNHIDSQNPTLRKKYVDKYIAANLLTITPWEWLDFSVGNSFVYSGNLRPEMFIPFMYYKVMDHNTGREGLDDGNGQIFFDLKFSYIQNVSIYSSVLIDVLEIRPILKGEWYTSWFGYTLGGKFADFIIPNLTLILEYTKTNPWVYENNDQSTDYKHLGYSLGHWIGQNADLLSVQFEYKFLRSLSFAVTGEMFRKGGLKDIIYAYKNRVELPFLYSPLRKENSLEVDVKYEPFYDLRATGFYRYSNITDEDSVRTYNWQLGSKHSFGLTISYGL